MNGIMIPMKNLIYSKQRMFPFLTGKKKEQFVSLMLRDVLGEVIKAQTVDDIFILTSDKTIISIAREYKVNVIYDHKVTGLNQVLRLGYSQLNSSGYTNITIIPGDIPLISYRELDQIFNDNCDVTIVPAHDGKGTNALRINYKSHFSYHYGENSFEKHLREISIHKLSYNIRQCKGIAFDVDFPTQLNYLAKQDNLSSQFIKNSGVLEQIRDSKMNNHLSVHNA